jgi:translation initiation factor 1
MGGDVYSTRDGRLCADCGRPVAHCVCARMRPARPTGDGRVRVGRETQGRKGKGVTVVRGLLLVPDELKELARELKARCGTGGTVKDGAIEIQGDHRDLVVAELVKRGFDAKRSGG